MQTKLNARETLRQTNRQYTRSNRANWEELGFRTFTCLVHDDERQEVLAELEIRKCDAMVAMAESPKTPPEKLLVMSQRNMTTLPLKGELSTLAAAAENSKAKTEVLKLLDIAKQYVRRYRGIENMYEKAGDAGKKVEMAAKAVAYSAACAAQIRYAKVLLDNAPNRDETIFGAREQVDLSGLDMEDDE